MTPVEAGYYWARWAVKGGWEPVEVCAETPLHAEKRAELLKQEHIELALLITGPVFCIGHPFGYPVEAFAEYRPLVGPEPTAAPVAQETTP